MKNILNNVTIRIGTTPVPSTIVLTKMNTQLDSSGYMSRFVLLLQEYLGFNYELSVVNWAEKIDYLKQNKIELCFPIAQTFKRSKIIDFSQTFIIQAVKFVVGKPEELSKVTAILRPFLIQVWIAIILTFIISVIVFTIILRNEANLLKRKVKINEIAWALFGSLTNQGNDLFSLSDKACQLLFSGWLLATFVITSSYSGALMSFITFPGRESVPRTFIQLVKMTSRGSYITSTRFDTPVMKYIFESTDGIGVNLRKLYELNKLENGKLNENVAKRILKEKYAFIFYDAALDIFISIFGSENFLISEDQLFTANMGFGISKEFPYKKELNKAILRCIEAGFWTKFKKNEKMKAEQKYNSIIQENGDIHHALNVTDLAGPLLVLIIGYSLSIIVFFIELMVGKLSR